MSFTASEDVLTVINNLDSLSFTNETARFRAKEAAVALLARLETPWETAFRWIYAGPTMLSALKIAVDLDLFGKWQRSGQDEQNIAQLAQLVSCDTELLARLVRCMGALHVLTEVREDVYQQTAFSSSIAVYGVREAIRHACDFNLPAFSNLPDYLGSIHYRNPSDPLNGNWQHLHGSEASFFGELARSPAKTQDFQAMMISHTRYKPSWVDIYPIQELLNGFKPGTALLVDVGGAQGHDIESFRTSLSTKDLPVGSLILQDQASVVGEIALDPAIKVMAHDFFQPQPIQYARTYYLHAVLHDWADDKAVAILEHLAAAMKSGYSKLLIHENVIRTGQPVMMATVLDFVMMAMFSAHERTEAMWTELLRKAGLKLVKLWPSLKSEYVIEAELA